VISASAASSIGSMIHLLCQVDPDRRLRLVSRIT
jgi:hypothetical protein